MPYPSSPGRRALPAAKRLPPFKLYCHGNGSTQQMGKHTLVESAHVSQFFVLFEPRSGLADQGLHGYDEGSVKSADEVR